MSSSNIVIPSVSAKPDNLKIPPINRIEFRTNHLNKVFLELMNRKIERYNELMQNPKKRNTDAVLLLLEEIDYCGDFLINHSDSALSALGIKWYLTSGVALQPGRFIQRLLVEDPVKTSQLDLEVLLTQAESAGVDKEKIATIRSGFSSAPYQNMAENLRNHFILQQLRKAILYAAMVENRTEADELHEVSKHVVLKEVDKHLCAVIQAEPELKQNYLLQQEYAQYFTLFYRCENKNDAFKFMRALFLEETYLLNASDETIIQYYKNNPSLDTIPQKNEDFGKDDAAPVKGRKVSIDVLKAEWVAKGACTMEQLKALAPALFQNYDLEFLAMGNNTTWRLKNKSTGGYLILRVAPRKLTNLDSIATLQDTPAGKYFTPEYVTLVCPGEINHVLSLVEYCSEGNLQDKRKQISSEDSVAILTESIQLLSPFFDFCARLIDENAYLTDIKLSNLLVDKISDLKSIRVCGPNTNVHRLPEKNIGGDISPHYKPPEYAGSYTVIEGDFLPDKSAHKIGEIYYDKTTHQYSVLGYNGELYQGQKEDLGNSKKRDSAIKQIAEEICFDMDKFMSYQMGLGLYNFLTGLTFIFEGEDNTECNEARRKKALEQLAVFKASGEFDYSAAVFQSMDGQILRELCKALLKKNPKERISIQTAIIKLNALKELRSNSNSNSKKVLLEEFIELYKAHNEQYNSDPNFLEKYQKMKDLVKEVNEAKQVIQNTNSLQQDLETAALELEAWLRHAVDNPLQEAKHFCPYYDNDNAWSQSTEELNKHLSACREVIDELSKKEISDSAAAEKEALLQQIYTILSSLEQQKNVATKSILELAKMQEAAAALKNYVAVLNKYCTNSQKSDLQWVKKSLSAFTQPLSTEELTQKLRKEATYLHYYMLYEEKNKQQNIPAYLHPLQQSLIYRFLEKNPNAEEKEIDEYLNDIFTSDKNLLEQAMRYEENIANQEYRKAYVKALAMNEQITTVYTKLLGKEDGDPIVVQMTQLRAEVDLAHKSGIVNSQGSAEMLQKVNLELVNSLSYIAGSRLTSSSYKPVHTDQEWEKFKKDSVNVDSPTKKLAYRVLMGVGISLALVLVVGTGGIAAMPIVAAEIAAKVSPAVANSAIGLVTASSILVRAKVAFSRNKKIKDSESLFNTTRSVVKDLCSRVPQPEVERPAVNPSIAANRSDLFYHYAAKKDAEEEPKNDDKAPKIFP